MLSLSLAAQTSPTAAPNPKPVTLSPFLRKAFGDFGGWWNSLSDEAKDNFLDGYTTALGRARSSTDAFAKQARENVASGPQFDDQIKHAMVLSFLATTFDYEQSSGSLKNGLNEFYKDPLNGRIMVSLALEHVRDQVENRKTPGELLDELNGWRKIVNSH